MPLSFAFTQAHADQARALFAQLPGPVFVCLRELDEAAVYLDSSEQDDDTLHVGPYSIVASHKVIMGWVPMLTFTVHESVAQTSTCREIPDDVDIVEFQRAITFGDALRAIVLREVGNYVAAIQFSDGLAAAYGED